MCWSPLNLGKGLVAPVWATTLGWVLTLSSVSLLPIWAVYALLTTPGTLPQVIQAQVHLFITVYFLKILYVNYSYIFDAAALPAPVQPWQTLLTGLSPLVHQQLGAPVRPHTAPGGETKEAHHNIQECITVQLGMLLGQSGVAKRGFKVRLLLLDLLVLLFPLRQKVLLLAAWTQRAQLVCPKHLTNYRRVEPPGALRLIIWDGKRYRVVQPRGSLSLNQWAWVKIHQKKLIRKVNIRLVTCSCRIVFGLLSCHGNTDVLLDTCVTSWSYT